MKSKTTFLLRPVIGDLVKPGTRELHTYETHPTMFMRAERGGRFGSKVEAFKIATADFFSLK